VRSTYFCGFFVTWPSFQLMPEVQTSIISAGTGRRQGRSKSRYLPE
jgi:hypothetical protein